MVNEFEATLQYPKRTDSRHHDWVPGIQKAFSKDVKALIAVLEELGNPFLADSSDFIALDTKDIMPQVVIESLNKIQGIGQAEYDQYVNE